MPYCGWWKSCRKKGAYAASIRSGYRCNCKKVCDEIKEILPEKSIFEDFIKNEESDFLEKEIQKAFLVVAATSSREENHRAAELCHAYHILVNVADSEAESVSFSHLLYERVILVLELTAGQEARLYPNRFVARLKKLFRIIMQILQFLWRTSPVCKGEF